MKYWSLLSIVLLSTPVYAQEISPQDRAEQQFQAGDYPGAIVTWQQTLQQTQDETQQAKLLENLARTYQKIGQSKSEIESWNQLLKLHQRTENKPALARILTEKAQALSRQGQSQDAIVLLCDHEKLSECSSSSAVGLARKLGDRRTEAAALGSLGEAHRLRGDYLQAATILTTAAELANTIQIPTFQAATNNSLGNTYSNLALTRYRKSTAFRVQDPKQTEKLDRQGKDYDNKALEAYQTSYQIFQNTNDRIAQFQVLTNLIPIYQRLNQTQLATQTWQQANQLLNQLPPSRTTAYGAIDLAQLLQPIRDPGMAESRCSNRKDSPQVEVLLQKGKSIANSIDDRRASSFVLGALGNLAECQGAWDQALDYAQQAILAAGMGDRDSLYLWEWQRGRVLKQKGKTKAAIVAYERSIQTLEQVRQEMVTANRDVQFDFRDTIDPIYRELVDLQLSQETAIVATKPKSNDKSTKSNNLQSTLSTLDSLKLAELQNYFGNNCVITFAKDRIDERQQQNAAVLTTVIGDDRTAVILSLPNGKKQFNWINVKRSELEKTVDNYRLGLESFDTAPQGYDTALAQKLYGWLIAPFEKELSETNTLVFVQDGLLRSVPMASLHDGKQFLIQKYAIATAPSLSLVDARPIDRPNLNLLAMGYTKEVTIGGNYFQALTQVNGELTGVAKSVPRITKLVDGDFNRKKISQSLQDSSYSVLHIATHGKFGIDAEDTFFVTGDSENPTFNLNELDQLIRRVSKNTKPLDLLVLTACETAIGDDRSALGLAGVAVQAGSSSAIASLWSINDKTTAQISTSLYEQLVNPDISKAQALQQAQKSMIEKGGVNAHPYYWSAFILVGNWL